MLIVSPLTTVRDAVAIAPEEIAKRIVRWRGERVLLDIDLATLYGVTTKRLNEQVKRNAFRFPDDFAFRLSAAEYEELNRSQIATGSQKQAVKTSTQLRQVFEAIRTLLSPPAGSSKRSIGFTADHRAERNR